MRWFKSSHSGVSNSCVECAKAKNGMFVRDSKVSNGPIVSVSRSAWTDFLSMVA